MGFTLNVVLFSRPSLDTELNLHESNGAEPDGAFQPYTAELLRRNTTSDFFPNLGHEAVEFIPDSDKAELDRVNGTFHFTINKSILLTYRV